MRTSSAFFASLLLIIAAGTAHADWPAGGKLVIIVDDSSNGLKSVRFLDLPTGEMYVLSVGRGGNVNGYTLQRIGSGGDVAPGWTTNGYSFTQYLYSSTLMGFTVDDSGCVWRAQYGLATPGGSAVRPQAQLVRSDGLPLPGSNLAWNANAAGGSNQGMAVAPASGGAYVAFGSTVQRMTRAGAIAPGWPANGVPGVNSHCPALWADGAGGVVVFGASAIGSQPTAQRVDANGARHSGWPAAGLLLASGPEDGLADFEVPNFLLPSGPGWLIAGWVTPYSSPTSVVKHLQLQRFSLDGTLDPAWPANGVTAIATDSLTGGTLIADGLGGVHALWYAHGRPLGTHLRADGTFQPGLTAAGIDLAAGDPDFKVPGYSQGRLAYMVADAAADGGLIFAYDNFLHFFTASYHVRWLNADYTPNPSEPAGGRLVVPAERGRSVRAVHADGIGGAYLAWDVSPDNDPNAHSGQPSELWMTRLLPSSLVGVPLEPHRGSLTLSAPRPNPARGAIALDVTLPDDSPARVELLDVAGRVQRSQTVEGAGSHQVDFGSLGTLAPGLYFARVSQAGGEATTRVVITR